GCRNSSISARRMENAEGCLLRSSSENSFGKGFRRPRRAEPYRPKESQCGCRSRIGSSMEFNISPRRLRGRNSTSRSTATISSGGRVEAKSQREYLPGNSYPEERYTPRCESRSLKRRFSPFLKLTLDTTRVTAIPLGVEYLSSGIKAISYQL